MKRFFALLFSLCLIFNLSFDCAAQPIFSITAQCCVLIDAASGCVIYEKNAYKRASMASTTKIMTALILSEQPDLEKEITVTDSMVRVEGSSMGLLEGDKVKYIDLLYGLLLASGNDAANAVAISLGGSLENFAEMMNDRAAQIGMSGTRFVTPSGLDDENHYSTAYDMALLSCVAMDNELFASVCSSKKAVLEFGNPPYKRTITNHNKLLKLYDGCIGVKTGFTKKSGRCLVSCAQKGDKRVICVTLNAPDDWNDHVKLLDFGFSKLETRSVSMPYINPVKIIGGERTHCEVMISDTDISTLPENFNSINFSVSIEPSLIAPVNRGDAVGTVTVKIKDKSVKNITVYAAKTVKSNSIYKKKDFLFWLRQILSY